MERQSTKERKRLAAIGSSDIYIAGPNMRRTVFVHELLVLKNDIPVIIWRAWSDVKARYRRSLLGPYWLSIGTFAFIIGYSVLAGLLFKRPLQDFLGFIAAGVITWQFIASSLSEGTKIFVANASEISSMRVNFLSLPVKLMLRGLIGFAHSLPIVICVVAFTDGLSFYTLLFIPGLMIIVLTMLPLVMALGTLSARYRDIEQLVTVLIQFMFYMTPIIWKPELLGTGNGKWVALANPLYYELSIVRGPLLGQPVALEIWACAIAFMLVSMVFGTLIYARFRQRIPFWI